MQSTRTAPGTAVGGLAARAGRAGRGPVGREEGVVLGGRAPVRPGWSSASDIFEDIVPGPESERGQTDTDEEVDQAKAVPERLAAPGRRR
jgi:hypothetical protein